MTLAAFIGWAVVHSLWQGALIAGLTAMTLSLIGDRHARARHRLAGVGLAAMVIAPIATAAAGAGLLDMDMATRRATIELIDTFVPMPTIVRWRAVVVPAVAVFWIAGVAASLAGIGGQWRRARDLRRRGVAAAADSERAIVAELQSRWTMRTPVAVHRSSIAAIPMVLGWRRPVILLPASSIDRLDHAQLGAILAHELAHVRRRDYLINLLQVAADALLFHHPGARWLSCRIRVEREYCCDDIAMAAGSSPAGYARALAALEDARDGTRLAVAASSGTLLDRIQRIAGQPRPLLTPARGALALVTACAVAAILAGMAAIVPPSIPLDAKMRSRSSRPAGMPLPAPPAPGLGVKRSTPGDPPSPQSR